MNHHHSTKRCAGTGTLVVRASVVAAGLGVAVGLQFADDWRAGPTQVSSAQAPMECAGGAIAPFAAL